MVEQVQLYIILSITQVSFHAAKSYHIVKNILKSFKLYIQKTNFKEYRPRNLSADRRQVHIC